MTVIAFRRKNTAPTGSEPPHQPPPAPQGALAVGIDLGTTNSVVSILEHAADKPQTLLYENHTLIPSLIYYDPADDKILVGMQAKAYLGTDPVHVIRSTKRHIGHPDTLFYSNDRSFSGEDAACHILTYIANHPTLLQERRQHGGIWAVITVPAHFDDASRTATLSAAKRAGIHVLRVINEPTAAALAYSMLSEEEKHTHENLAVFDFGGGTFDVTIVEKQGLTFNVLSSEGDTQLGGDDVDDALAHYLLKKVTPPFAARQAKPNSPLFLNILNYAQQAKKELQTAAAVTLYDTALDDRGSAIDMVLERADFEQVILPVLEKTLSLTQSAIQMARRVPENISKILLVGGSTRLNLVRTLLRNYFPCAVDGRLEPDLAVSWGASLQAAMILGIHLDTILVDVCSHTLGIGVVLSDEEALENTKQIAKKFGISLPITEHSLKEKLGAKAPDFYKEVESLLKVAPILCRNSPLPAKKSEFFQTVYHNQQGVQVIVVQGEEPLVGQNRFIGSFLFELQQPCPKGTRCEIQLTYDVNGMVQVFAKQLDTQNEAKALFDSRTGKVVGWSELHNTNDPHKPPTEADCAPILNSIILNTKKFLDQNPVPSEKAQEIQNTLQRYTQLLSESRMGQNHDEELEDLENSLVCFYEAPHAE